MTHRPRNIIHLLLLLAALPLAASAALPVTTAQFIEQHCADCHDAETQKGGLYPAD